MSSATVNPIAHRGELLPALRPEDMRPWPLLRVAITLVIGCLALVLGLVFFSPTPDGAVAALAIASLCLPVAVTLGLRSNAVTLFPLLELVALWVVPLALVARGSQSLSAFGFSTRGASLLFIVGNVAYAAGLLMGSTTGRFDNLVRSSDEPIVERQARPIVLVLLGVISTGATIYFLHAVGGFQSYFSNLNASGQFTVGLTPVVWGLFLARYAGVVLLNGATDRRTVRLGWAVWLYGMILTAVVGTRLFLVIGVLEIAIVVWRKRPLQRDQESASRRRKGQIVWLGVLVSSFAVAVFALGLYRTNLGLVEAGQHRLAPGIGPFLGRYVNNYADTVRTAEAITTFVPSHVAFNDGVRIVQALSHVLPRPLRLNPVPSPYLVSYIGGVGGHGSALPLQTEGYLAYGYLGTAGFMVIIGLAVRILAERWSRQSKGFTSPVYLGCVVAVLLLLRGSMPSALTFGCLEILGMWLVQRWVWARA